MQFDLTWYKPRKHSLIVDSKNCAIYKGNIIINSDNFISDSVKGYVSIATGLMSGYGITPEYTYIKFTKAIKKQQQLYFKIETDNLLDIKTVFNAKYLNRFSNGYDMFYANEFSNWINHNLTVYGIDKNVAMHYMALDISKINRLDRIYKQLIDFGDDLKLVDDKTFNEFYLAIKNIGSYESYKAKGMVKLNSSKFSIFGFSCTWKLGWSNLKIPNAKEMLFMRIIISILDKVGELDPFFTNIQYRKLKKG